MTVGTARLLDTARGGWIMAGVLAVMIFLAVLATAGGIATASASHTLGAALAGQATVQIVAADRETRERLSANVADALRRSPVVVRVTPISRAELARLLGPWLGTAADADDLPVPALIDVTLAAGGDAAARLRRIVAPFGSAVQIDAHAAALAGTERLLEIVSLLAAAIVVLMIAAGMAMVLLSVRAGLAAHQTTIDVMHRLGATDAQVAILFCRRMARDAALAAAIGAPLGWAVIVLVGRIGLDTGSQLLGGMTLGRAGWSAAIALPVAFVLLAALVAYVAVRRALGRMV